MAMLLFRSSSSSQSAHQIAIIICGHLFEWLKNPFSSHLPYHLSHKWLALGFRQNKIPLKIRVFGRFQFLRIKIIVAFVVVVVVISPKYPWYKRLLHLFALYIYYLFVIWFWAHNIRINPCKFAIICFFCLLRFILLNCCLWSHDYHN